MLESSANIGICKRRMLARNPSMSASHLALTRSLPPWHRSRQGVDRDYPVRRQPKHRVHAPQVRMDAMPSTTEITVTQLSRLVGLPTAPAIVDVRIDEDSAADPRLLPGARRRPFQQVAAWAAGYAGKTVIVVCQRGAEAEPGRRRLAAARGHRRADAGGRLRGLAQGGRAARAHRQAPAARREGPHRVGDARAAQGRPHRLPLADPALRRSRRGVPVRGAVRGGGRRRALQGDAVRHRGHVLEPSRRRLHLRHHDRGVRPQAAPLLQLAAIVRGADTARLDLAPQSAGLLAASLGLSRMYPRRSRAARSRHGALRCLLSLVPGRDRGDPQLAVDQGAS